MRKVIALAALAVLVMAGGCMVSTKSSLQAHDTYPVENSRVFSSGIDKTWDAAVSSLTENFFSLTNVSKDSGIITIDFSAENPAEYIDCGTTTVETDNKKYVFKNTDKITTYELPANRGSWPGTFTMIRATSLQGKINIVFTGKEREQTSVTVTARFVLSAREEGRESVAGMYSRLGYVDHLKTNTYSATTGSPTGECVSTYALEKKILDAIAAKL